MFGHTQHFIRAWFPLLPTGSIRCVAKMWRLLHAAVFRSFDTRQGSSTTKCTPLSQREPGTSSRPMCQKAAHQDRRLPLVLQCWSRVGLNATQRELIVRRGRGEGWGASCGSLDANSSDREDSRCCAAECLSSGTQCRASSSRPGATATRQT